VDPTWHRKRPLHTLPRPPQTLTKINSKTTKMFSFLRKTNSNFKRSKSSDKEKLPPFLTNNLLPSLSPLYESILRTGLFSSISSAVHSTIHIAPLQIQVLAPSRL